MTSEKYLGHIEESDTDLWQIECPKDYTIKALLNVLSHTNSSGSNYELNLKGYLIRCKSLSNSCKQTTMSFPQFLQRWSNACRW